MLLMMYQTPEIVNEVSTLLLKPIPRAAEDIDDYIVELDAIRLPLAEAVADIIQLLYEKRKQLPWPKDAPGKMTEMDREIRLKGDIAPLERDYEFLIRLERLVEHRINLGTILRHP